jgi:hypothetical protein
VRAVSSYQRRRRRRCCCHRPPNPVPGCDPADIVKPDIFFVNEDGDRENKRTACADRGIKYVVAAREPAAGLEARSSTSVRAMPDWHVEHYMAWERSCSAT